MFNWQKVFNRKFLVHFLIFILLNIIFFVNILLFNSKFEFNTLYYKTSAYHFFEDPRFLGGSFNLLNSLGQYDAQWYLKIASEGYPKIENNLESVKERVDYAFFPLYPLLIKFFSLFLKDVSLSAFFLSIFFILINYISLIFIIKKSIGYTTAVKTAFLLFFFPFAVFYRGYFTEGLYLFLLLWFSYFLLKRYYIKSAFFLSLLNVTKASGFLLNALFLFLSLKDYIKAKISLRIFLVSLLIIFTPFAGWMIFNYMNTESFVYFLKIRYLWLPDEFLTYPFIIFLFNIFLIFRFTSLSLHAFHSSRVEIFTFFVFLFLLIFGRKKMPNIFCLVSFCLWLSPLLVTDLMSFSRYQTVNFPIFVYLAGILKGKYFYVFFLLSYLALLITSLFFVNWWWVG